MSSLKDAYYTPTCVGGWDAREREEDTYRNNLKHIIVSSRVLRTQSSLSCEGRKGMKTRLSCPTEFAVDFGALHRFENTVRVIKNGSATKLLHLTLFIQYLLVLLLAFVFHIQIVSINQSGYSSDRATHRKANCIENISLFWDGEKYVLFCTSLPSP